MNQNYQRNQANRDRNDPGNKAQAAALGTGDRSQQAQGRSQSKNPPQGRAGRGWDDLSAETLNTDQTTRR
jgi:hypothetical protein